MRQDHGHVNARRDGTLGHAISAGQHRASGVVAEAPGVAMRRATLALAAAPSRARLAGVGAPQSCAAEARWPGEELRPGTSREGPKRAAKTIMYV